ncbi:MAG: metallophosphoesterase [Myxococcota bacterium]
MRVAHATDIHWTEDVPLSRLPGKRVLGTANQVLRGRRHHFPEAVQQALMDHLLAQAPDVFVVTGDLTAQALPSEFEKAKRFLQPVMEAIPTVVLPGNHDLYTQGARDADRIGEYFGPWMRRDGALQRFEHEDLVVLGLDPNRPTWIHASGVIPDAQLEALAEALDDRALEGRFVLLALHYPILDRHGAVYDGTHHGLLNARALIDVLAAARIKPDLAIFGHEHHGYQASLDLGGTALPCVNSGSSGYAFMPEKRRAAAMNIYDVGTDGFTIERFLYDGAGFAPEPGGAYATGR